MSRFLARVEGLLARRRSAAGHRLLYGLAALAFVAATALGVRALPPVEDPQWGLLVIALVLAAPLTALVNGAEYVVTARILGYRIAVSEAIRVAVLASAANLLPVPGSIVVRAQALRRRGATTGRAVWATAVTGLAWIAVALAMAGALQATVEPSWIAAGVTALGVVCLAGVAVAVRAIAGGGRAGLTLALVAVEVGAVVVGAGRFLLVMHGVGIDAGARQALALSVSGVLAALIGIFPGGLGIRELLAGLIAPVVGLTASVGVVVSAVDRVVALPALAVMALAAAAARPTAPDDGDDEGTDGVAQ